MFYTVALNNNHEISGLNVLAFITLCEGNDIRVDLILHHVLVLPFLSLLNTMETKEPPE